MEETNDKKIFVNQNGEKKEAEVIAVFEMKNFGKEYMLYTFNELKKDNVKILASTLKRNDDSIILESIATVEEWDAIKEVIKDLATQAKGDVDV